MATSRNQDQAEAAKAEPTEITEGYDGVVIGLLLGFYGDGAPLVVFPGNPEKTAGKAHAITRLQDTDIGREVALLFECGDPRYRWSSGWCSIRNAGLIPESHALPTWTGSA